METEFAAFVAAALALAGAVVGFIEKKFAVALASGALALLALASALGR